MPAHDTPVYNDDTPLTVRCAALKLVPTIAEDGYTVLSYTPKWCSADGPVETNVLCSRTFDLNGGGTRFLELYVATCIAGAFFLVVDAAQNSENYDITNPTYTLFYSEVGESSVVELASCQTYQVSQFNPSDSCFVATRDGDKVTFAASSLGRKISFTKTNGVWSAAYYTLPGTGTASGTAYGWVDNSGDNLYLVASDHDGMLNLFTTPMSTYGNLTFVRLADANDATMYFAAGDGGNFFCTPLNSQERGLFFTLDRWSSSPGLYFAEFNTSGMSATNLTSGVIPTNLLSRSPALIVYKALNGTTVAWAPYSGYKTEFSPYGPGLGTICPAGYLGGVEASPIDGEDYYGVLKRFTQVTIWSDYPAALKICQYGGGTPDSWDIFVGRANTAKFSNDTSAKENFIAFWADVVGDIPKNPYPQFFMSFAKSYEVRGYKP